MILREVTNNENGACKMNVYELEVQVPYES